MDGRSAQGRFEKGCVANPGGNNQFTSIVPLIDALKRAGEGQKESFWDMVARKAWTSEPVLIAILRKIIPDKALIESDVVDPLEKFRNMSVAELRERAYKLINGEKVEKLPE